MQMQIDHIQLEAVQGDIANQPDIIAVVNAAKEGFKPAEKHSMDISPIFMVH